jgi:hypothetical protein
MAMTDARRPETTCHACSHPVHAQCVRCGRALCSTHRQQRSGISLSVFGLRFDDAVVRCGDCYAARFWRASLALTAIIGAAVALLSLAKGELLGVLAGGVLGVIGALFSHWRAVAFERRASVRRRF